MSTIQIPEVSFSLQSVVPNFPAELHEAIDLTPELIEFAQAIVPAFELASNTARDAELMSLKISDGEASWNAANGPQNSRSADHAAQLLRYVRMLARGENYTSFDGWIDRRDWLYIVARISA